MTGSYGPLVVAWARDMLGLDLRGWQAYALGRMLEHDATGDLVAKVALTSTARQNGKTVKERSLIGWGLTSVRWWRLIVSAAYDRDQARIPYDELLQDFGRSAMLRRYATLTQHRGIRTPGRLYRTLSRDSEGIRGLSPGLVSWDEVRTQKTYAMFAALRPAMIAQPRALMTVTSTAGDESSVVLRDMFDRGRAMAEGTMRPDPAFLMLWWAAPDAAIDRAEPVRSEILAANPAMTAGRISWRDVLAEHRATPRAEFVRERLNLWMDQAPSAFAPGAWAECRVEAPLEATTGPVVVAVDAVASWRRATIAVARIRPDGRVGVEIARDLRTHAMTARPVSEADVILELDGLRARHEVRAIRGDANAAVAPILKRYGERHGEAVTVELVGPADFARDCSDLEEHVLARRLAHGDPLLDAQLSGAVRLDRGDGGWRWGRRKSSTDIDAVVAMTLAVSGAARPIVAKVPQIF